MSGFRYLNIPTYAKKIQYMPANIGNGMDANRAPNFPVLPKQRKYISAWVTIYVHNQNPSINIHRYEFSILPRTAKKIMNPADICTTLLLPTCVKASKPIFSLKIQSWQCQLSKISETNILYNQVCHFYYPQIYTYTATEVPLAVPKNESSKIPMPWKWRFRMISIPE